MKSKLFVLGVVVLSLMMLVSCADKNLRQGKILLKQTPPEYEAAIQQFEKSIEYNPNNPEAYFLLGQAYMKMEKYHEMDKAYSKAVEQDPSLAEEINTMREQVWAQTFNKGLEDSKREDWPAALEKYETCMVIDPTKYESFSNAGFVAYKLELPEKALEYNKRAYELKKDDMDIIRNYAATLFRQERYPEALDVYNEAKNIEPNNANISIRIGQIYEKLKDYKNAVAAYNNALEIDPTNSNLWYNAGVIYFSQLEDYEKAEHAFAKAVETNPDDEDAGFNQVMALLKLEKFQEAIPVLATLESKNPDNCDIYDLQAQVYQELGDKKNVNLAVAKSKKCRGE